jgi:trimethylamine:corrinoid methyltransferase-like protein
MVRSKLIRKGVIMVGNKNIGGLYQPLSDAQVETIHNAALTILEDVGIAYTPDQSDLIEELRIAGARIERDESRKTVRAQRA